MGKDKNSSLKQETVKKILTWTAILGGVGVIAFLVIYSPEETPSNDPRNSLAQPVSSTKETEKQDPKLLEGLEFFPNEGQEHVPDGTRVLYKTDPPTSGRHYDKWLPPGVYEKDKTTPEFVVHNLEHGNVVIYLDPDQLAPADRDSILELPKKYAGQWDGVVLITHKGLSSPLILTAWRAKLPLPRYDADKLSRFLDAFRGRGPENPVR